MSDYIDHWRGIPCPHCKGKNNLEPEDVPWNDGDGIEHDCGQCGKPMSITAWVTTNWIVEIPEDYEEVENKND